MNICMLTSTAFPLIGGLETVVHNLSTALANSGHKVYHITPRNPCSGPDRHYNYKVIKFGFKGYGRLKLVTSSALCILAYVVKRHSIDIINVHNVSTPGSWAYYFKQFFRGIPVIGTPHGDDIQIFPKIGWGIRLDPHQDRVIRRNLKSFSKVVAISPSIRQELLGLGLDEKNIASIPNGIWYSNLTGPIDTSQTRKRFSIPTDTINLISVGRNHPVKGFHHVLDTVSTLKKMGFNISYTLVGRDMESIRQKAEMLSISDKIITPGEVDSNTVSYLLKSSDIFISSSLIESFGLTTLEAMVSGLPCVVTDAAGSKDLVSREFGIFYEFGDIEQLTNSILFLLKNPSERDRMGEAAKQAGSEYDWRKISNQYENVYKSVL